MPMDRSLYPENWEEIALKIKQGANWICEECGKPCRKPGETVEALWNRLFEMSDLRWLDELCGRDLSIIYLRREYEAANRYPQRFTLTVSHTNHDPWNPDAELRALCTPCHCRYDISPMQMERKRKAKLEYLGQENLLEVNEHG